mmetsp:Transcript_47846/g.113923  ORF Transcript_47846/g.113923 Transcript_47846/m.113923 type:complete len:314 (+) Transcript_47846:26-967(+)
MRVLDLKEWCVDLACFLFFFVSVGFRPLVASSAATASLKRSPSLEDAFLEGAFRPCFSFWESRRLFFRAWRASCFARSGSELPFRTADLAARCESGALSFFPRPASVPNMSSPIFAWLCTALSRRLSISSSSFACRRLLLARLIPAYLSSRLPVRIFFLEILGVLSSSSSSSSSSALRFGAPPTPSSVRPLAGLVSRVSRFSWLDWNHDFFGRDLISSSCSIRLRALSVSWSAIRIWRSTASSSRMPSTSVSHSSILARMASTASLGTTRRFTTPGAPRTMSLSIFLVREESSARVTAFPLFPARAVRPTRCT